jgi:Dienelactone hydrolase and related enzymes
MNINLITEDAQTISAYCAGDENSKRGLVVLQEIFGVNSHIRNVCDRFAQEGYYVIAPALFDRAEKNVELGYTGDDVQAGLALRSKVALEDTLKDIDAAIKHLDDRSVAIVGYCWGGALAWQAAAKLGGLSAASCWYGGGIAQAKDLTARIPVQMHFGDQDGSIPMADVEAIQAAQPGVELHVYQGAGHGFGCDQRGSFNEAAYKLAQERTLRFFDEHLA